MSATYTFENESDVYLTSLSMRLAADKFAENARTSAEVGNSRLAWQFNDQERRARAIADGVENAVQS